MPYRSMFDAYMEGKKLRRQEDMDTQRTNEMAANNDLLREQRRWQVEQEKAKMVNSIMQRYSRPAKELIDLHDNIAKNMGFNPNKDVLAPEVEDYISTQMAPVYDQVAAQFNKDAGPIGGSASPKFNRMEMMQFLQSAKPAGGVEYSPVETAGGYRLLDKKTGSSKPWTDESGRPIMPFQKPPKASETAGERSDKELAAYATKKYGIPFSTAEITIAKKNSSGAMAMPGEFDNQLEAMAKKKGWKPKGTTPRPGLVIGDPLQ